MAEEPLSWAALRREAADRLRAAGVRSAEAEARWLVEEAAADVDGPVTTRAIVHFDAMLARREAGEPLQYVLGRWGFRSLDLLVDRRVLIPRPETEVVAGLAIEEARRASSRRADGCTVLDLGTGSGAIALSVAVEVPTATVWGADRSDEALEVARANLAGIGRPGARVRLVRSDWFGGLPDELVGAVDVIVSNPPYVADADELPREVEGWEPVRALRAGPEGLDDLRRIVAGAPRWLARSGSLVVELAPAQAAAVVELARSAGFGDVAVAQDLTGRDRAVVARLP